MPSRSAFIHAGTHKTGSKSLQLYMARNVGVLGEAGIYVPDAGRHHFDELRATPGHHALATGLGRGEREQLDALLAEIGAAGFPNILLSSEEFHPLISEPGILAPLSAALSQRNYATTAIVYLRAQGDYATSLYAELMKNKNALPFGSYLRSVLETGRFVRSERYVIHFEYSHLLVALAALFGQERVVVRPYDATAESAALIRDFIRVLTTLHPPLRAAALSDPSLAVNTRSTFRDVLEGIYEGARARYPDAPGIDALAARLRIDTRDPRFGAAFAPLLRDEALAFAQRFADDNARVASMTNLTIPGAREEDVAQADDSRWALARWQREVLDIMTDVWLR